MDRWDEIASGRAVTAVLDAKRYRINELGDLMAAGTRFIVEQGTDESLASDCINRYFAKSRESRHYLGDYALYGFTETVHHFDSQGHGHPLSPHVFRSDRRSAIAVKTMERQCLLWKFLEGGNG